MPVSGAWNPSLRFLATPYYTVLIWHNPIRGSAPISTLGRISEEQVLVRCFFDVVVSTVNLGQTKLFCWPVLQVESGILIFEKGTYHRPNKSNWAITIGHRPPWLLLWTQIWGFAAPYDSPAFSPFVIYSNPMLSSISVIMLKYSSFTITPVFFPPPWALHEDPLDLRLTQDRFLGGQSHQGQ